MNNLKLHPYEIEGVKFLLSRKNAGLFWRPGLGKTVTCLAAITAYLNKYPDINVLVVSKKLVVESTWIHEIHKFGFSLTYTLIEGTPAERAYYLRSSNTNIFLINFELLQWLTENPAFLKFTKGILVIDESTQLKNWSGKRFNALKPYLRLFSKRIILTGTPIPNGIIDIFAQMYIVDKGDSLGTSIGKFREKYFSQNAYTYQYKLKNLDCFNKITDKLKPKILTYGDDLLELPKLNIVDLQVELNSISREQYSKLESEFFLALQEDEITITSQLALGTKLRQFMGGYIYNDAGGYNKINNFKIKRAIDLIEDLQGSPILVLCEFKIETKELQNKLEEKFPDYVIYKISAKDNHLIELWNKGEINILIAHPETIAHGVNLQDAPHSSILFYSIPWKLENYTQTIDRLHRQGRKESVFVYRLITEDTIDEDIAKRLLQKDNTQQNLLSSLKSHMEN